ncbi:MAG TPA: rRNA maturation RNase YbeY [Pyrinomonadaceae bacterium]|nr:rRNA maturation RNase YbeY [Pyrinomonadaceae bacterium]
MTDVVDLQRKVKLDLPQIRAFVERLPEMVPESGQGTFSVAFVSDRRMRELNMFFRGKDSTTDVLSFPHVPDEFVVSGPQDSRSVVENASPDTKIQDFLGDIVISAEQAARQAGENELSLDIEIKQLVLHGLLHLCGYDHETDDGEMDACELDLRERLGISK